MNTRLILSVLMPLALLVPAGKGDEPSPKPASTVRPYTNQPSTSSVRVQTSYPGGTHRNTNPLLYHGTRTSTVELTVRTSPTLGQLVRFPRAPFALYQPAPSVFPNPETTSAAFSQMRPYLGDRFAPALFAYILDETLSDGDRRQILAFDLRRNALLADLKASIVRTASATPEDRLAQREAFAASQQDALQALEEEEERLRKRLVEGSFWKGGVKWSDARTWRLGDNLRYETPIDEGIVALASAYFTDGFRSDQRDLLIELAMDLFASVSAADVHPTAMLAREYIAFLPASSRVTPPLSPSQETRDQLARLAALKHELKAELRSVIYVSDRYWAETNRTLAARDLAKRQASRLAELERLAEQIRRGPDRFPGPNLWEADDFPQGIQERIHSYIAERTAFQILIKDRLAATRAALPKCRVDLVKGPLGYSIEVTIPGKSTRKTSPSEQDRLVAELNAFNKTSLERQAALNAARDEMNRALTQYALNRSEKEPDVDALLQALSESFMRRELAARYVDYRNAVLEPGLSPTQRRLLFHAAHRDLL
jgi:hypothetical protein